jgi:hypothetical protein
MEPQNVQIAPEIIQAIIAQATARGLSVDEYLRQIHGVIGGTPPRVLAAIRCLGMPETYKV